MMQYTQDYDERYPQNWWCQTTLASCPADALDADSSKPSGTFKVAANSGGSPGHYKTWMDFIFPYVKSTQVFVCPSFNQPPDTSGSPNSAPSYGYSDAFGGFSVYNGSSWYNGGTGDWTPISMASVTRPSEVICVAEWQSYYSYALLYNIMSQTYMSQIAPHLEGGNTLYADGHVKWRSKGTMLASYGVTNPAWNPFK
jgi:prepilin-type processing-associated H-X9-DG protein